MPSLEAAWTPKPHVFKALFQTRVLKDVYSSLSSCFAMFLALCLSRLSSLVYIFPLLGKSKTLSPVDYRFLIINQTKEVSSPATLGTKVCLRSEYFFPQPSVVWTPPSFVVFPPLIILLEKQH